MDLQTIFNHIKNERTSLSTHYQSLICREERYDGPFYTITPYELERAGLEKGKIIHSVPMLTSNKYYYGFNKKDEIVIIKEGIKDLSHQFYCTFVSYQNDGIVQYTFDNQPSLINVIYLEVIDEKIVKKSLCGKRGSRDESYFYKEDGILDYILTRQYDNKGIEYSGFKEEFEYGKDGVLQKIVQINDTYSKVLFGG